MTDPARVTFENGHHGKQPGWFREDVRLDGQLIGHLDRHEVGFGVEWLIADPKWNSVGERRYRDRDAAVQALVKNATSS